MSANPNFLLTPQQQELLFAALNANRPANSANTLTLSPTSLDGSPAVSKALELASDSYQDNSFLDYDYSFDAADSSLNFSLNHGDNTNMADALGDGANDDSKTESTPSTTENDSPDKRVHPEDDDEEESSAKRREGGEKVPKKPGRKPLTSEPSSKRKAQNRAAQRAFRERKEKHVRDLELKVEELERTSAITSSENSLLRSKVEKMSVQLNEYKKRLAIFGSSWGGFLGSGHQQFGNKIFSNINDVNFQFEFPKFGQLPGSSNGSTATATAAARSNSQSSPTAVAAASTYRSSTVDISSPALDGSTTSVGAFSSNQASPQDTSRISPAKTTKDDLSKLSNAFTPPLPNSSIATAARSSLDSGATSSPSASSNSNTAPSSSCGTSPEPFNQSPSASKPLEMLTTIGEEQLTALTGSNGVQDHSQFGGVNINDIAWSGPQNGFRFDPQLFGDYRESQENILSNGGFDDSFFNDALDIDFVTPFNIAPSPVVPHKPDIIAEIDAAKESEFSSSSLNGKLPAGQTTPHGTLLTCNTIWERLQTCPKVQNGDFDLDGLCSDLQKKAKCSGSGAVVDETDFKAVMNKYLGNKDGDDACVQNLAASMH